MADRTSSTNITTLIKSTCHCGAITITVQRKPEYINECKCSICRRYAAAWGYYKLNEVEIDKKGALREYIWGDRTVIFNFCETCGCVVYWWPIDTSPEGSYEMGVNTRNMNPRDLEYVNITIDNAMSSQPVNDPSKAHADDLAKY